MRISSNLQLGIIQTGSCYRVTCTNTYYKPTNKTPKIKVNLFDTDGVLIEKTENRERSLRRARVSVVDYALCNNFDYFGTITFNGEWHDVTNAVACRDAVLDSFNHYQQRNNTEFQYLLVGEYGEKTGRLHFHFLIRGINKEDLFINHHHKLDWKYTSERFGFTQITKIKDTDFDRQNVARYCSKYITKGNIRISNHRYYCSKTLKKPVINREYDVSLTVFVSDWLKENAQTPYADNRMCEAYSLHEIVYKALIEAVEEFKKRREEEISLSSYSPLLFRLRNQNIKTPFDEA